jgi:tetratricopeptide (TPR) repeat protein
LRLQQELVKTCPKVPAYRHDLGVTLNRLGMVLRRQGQLAQARAHLEQATEEHLAAVRPNPRHAVHRRALLRAEANLGDVLGQMKDHAGLARAAEKLQGARAGAEAEFQAARLLARAVPLAKTEAPEQAETYARRAVERLGQAVREGLPNQGRLRNDRLFAPLRERADFRAVLEQVGP